MSVEAPGVTETEHGLVWVWDGSSQLTNTRCTLATSDRLIDLLAHEGIRKITGHDKATKEILTGKLSGWSVGGLVVMAQLESPTIESNSSVEIESIDPRNLEQSESFRRLFEEGGYLA